MQSDYVTVHDASLNLQKEKPPVFKGVVDHTLDVWSVFAQCRCALQNDTWSICFYVALIRLSEQYTTIEHL